MTQIHIEYQCPQCGAPAAMEETDRLFECPYCRVRSYLLPAGAPRYQFPVAEDREYLFVPYWRFKGMLFACTGEGIVHRFADVSQTAGNFAYFPPSLGLRSQALKLRIPEPGAGRFIRVMDPLQKALRVVEQRILPSLPQPVFHHAWIGETASVIYAPFYHDGRLRDGILKEPVSEYDVAADALAPLPVDAHLPRVQFIPAICPQCGWDLEADRTSMVLICRQCTTAWQPLPGRLAQIHIGVLGAPMPAPPVTFLPFWRITANVTGITCETMGDLARIANLPRVLTAAQARRPVQFWTLAFKVRSSVFLRLVSQILVAQPAQPITSASVDGAFYPVTLPVREAADSLKLALAAIMTRQKDQFPLLNQIHFTPQRFLLVYIPFSVGPHELIQPQLGLTLQRRQLDLGSYL